MSDYLGQRPRFEVSLRASGLWVITDREALDTNGQRRLETVYTTTVRDDCYKRLAELRERHGDTGVVVREN